MKKVTTLLAVVVLSITFFSCSKDGGSSTSSTTQPPQPKLQCYENGVLCIYDAVWDNRIGWIDYPNLNNSYTNQTDKSHPYDLFAYHPTFSNDTSVKHINFYFPNNNPLTVGSVNITLNDCWFQHNSFPKGSGVITITRLSNGTADGTFSGSFNSYSGSPATLNITQGQFSNIPVITY